MLINQGNMMNFQLQKAAQSEQFPQTLDILLDAIQVGMEIGDLENVGYYSAIYNINLILSGENLTSLSKQLDDYIILMENLNQQGNIILHQVWKQLVNNFLESRNNYQNFSGSYFNEYVKLPNLITTKSYANLFSLYLAKAIFYYLFKQTDLAINSCINGANYVEFVVCEVNLSQYNFYYSLSLLAAYSHQSPSIQNEYLAIVINNQEQMKKWANDVPMNYQHKYDLVAAEQARVFGNNWQAMELYDQAIIGAKENKYLHEQALANELAAQFYLDYGKVKIAQIYLIDAYYCYLNWDAKAKVKELEKSYPQLLEPILKQPAIENQEPASTSKIISDSHKNNLSTILELEKITQTSLAIAAEIQIDKLVDVLLDIIVENIDAKKAALILQHEGKLIIMAEYLESEKTDLRFTPVSNPQDLPLSIINYVHNKRKSVIINNAINEKNFASDAYIIQHQVKSIICNPIIHQEKLIGIIYLENNLSVGAFTDEKMKILQLLSSQAAIALANAQLYSRLEDKFSQRTQELNDKNLSLEKTLQELKSTQSQLIQTEKMSSLGQMVAGIAHEINNPVNFIYGNINHAKNHIKELINLMNLYQQEYPEITSLIQQKIVEIDLDFLVIDLPKILDSMFVGADRIRKIVLGLRNFSRLDEAEMKPVNIHEGIESTLMLLQPQFKEKLGFAENIVVTDYAELGLVNCYVSQLNQVFMNIISNAIDALHKYQNSLSADKRKDYLAQIKISTNLLKNNWVRISINDNAMGINPEIKQRIFDPFFTTKPVGEGTGLGLSISYQIIVDKHGGRLECISEPGKGTEFMIEIPMNINETVKTS